MTPTNITGTFPLDNPDARSRPMMHLSRGDDALVIPLACWELAVVLAAADGGWRPLGTSAEATDFGEQNPANAGHYIPGARQTIADRDARGLAEGLRRAEHTAKPDVIGASARRVPLGRWMARDGQQALTWAVDGEEKAIGIPAPQLAKYWGLWAQAPQIIAFLEGGTCQIMEGVPQKLLEIEAERERIAKLRREVETIEAELKSNKAARLETLKAELAAVGR